MEIEALVDIHDASAFLGLKPNSIRMMCAGKKIPFYKAGSRLRFKISELEEWAKTNAVLHS